MIINKQTTIFFLTVILITISCSKDVIKEILDDKYISTGSLSLDIKGESNNGYYMDESRQLNYNNTTYYSDINRFWEDNGKYQIVVSQTDGLPDECNVDWSFFYDFNNSEIDVDWFQINYNCVINKTSYLSLKIGGPGSSISNENYLTNFNFDTVSNYISGNVNLTNRQHTISATGYFQIKVFDGDSIYSTTHNY